MRRRHHLLDINGLKDINDGKGYNGGDAALTAVSRSVHELLPDTAVYRMGGDEFALLWQEGDEQAFRRDVERVRSLFAGTLGFTASVGCAWVRRGEDAVAGLVAADARMFAAKRDFTVLRPGADATGAGWTMSLSWPGPAVWTSCWPRTLSSCIASPSSGWRTGPWSAARSCCA